MTTWLSTRTLAIWSAASIYCVGNSVASAQLVPSTVTLTSGQDTQLDRLAPNTVKGNQATEMVDAFFKPEASRVAVKFDQAAINTALGTRDLVRARLVFTPSRYADSWGDSFLDAYRLTANWSQATATWNSMFLLSEPFDAVHPTVRVTVPNQSTAKVEFDVTKDVAAFTNGTPNYGWLIKDDGYFSGVSQPFYSFEGNATNRPQLIIESTAATEVGIASLQFTSPGTITVSSADGQEILNIPDQGRSFGTNADAIRWMAANLNSLVHYNALGQPDSAIGRQIQIGDLFYIDPVSGQAVEIDDIASALLGGKDGIMTIGSDRYCMRESGCVGLAFKARPKVDQECDTNAKNCVKGTSFLTNAVIYNQIGTKVEQREGGFHRTCGFCLKGKIFPWRCCTNSGANTLGVTNIYQANANEVTGPFPVRDATGTVSRSNVVQVKQKVYSFLQKKIPVDRAGDLSFQEGTGIEGVCGLGGGQGPAFSTLLTNTAIGSTEVACGGF